MAYLPLYGTDIPSFQKISVPDRPNHLAVDMDGTVWLLRNASPFLQSPDFLLVRSSRIAELPGYIDFFGIKKVESADYAAIAATGFRDQSSLHLFRKGNEIRAKVLQFVFSREDTAPAARCEKVVIGAEGENEWRRVEQGAIFSFTKPAMAGLSLLQKRGSPPFLTASPTGGKSLFRKEATGFLPAVR